MGHKLDFSRNQLSRSCFNQLPSFASSGIQRPVGSARSIINSTNPYLSRPDVAWTDEERQQYLNEKRLLAKYKTSLCTEFTKIGKCEWGTSCRFAHGQNELRPRPQPKNAKTVLCKNFESEGMCPYAGRCLFIHRRKPSADDILSSTNELLMLSSGSMALSKNPMLSAKNSMMFNYSYKIDSSPNKSINLDEVRAKLEATGLSKDP